MSYLRFQKCCPMNILTIQLMKSNKENYCKSGSLPHLLALHSSFIGKGCYILIFASKIDHSCTFCIQYSFTNVFLLKTTHHMVEHCLILFRTGHIMGSKACSQDLIYLFSMEYHSESYAFTILKSSYFGNVCKTVKIAKIITIIQ